MRCFIDWTDEHGTEHEEIFENKGSACRRYRKLLEVYGSNRVQFPFDESDDASGAFKRILFADTNPGWGSIGKDPQTKTKKAKSKTIYLCRVDYLSTGERLVCRVDFPASQRHRAEDDLDRLLDDGQEAWIE